MYNVILTGKLVAGADAKTAVTALAKLLRMERAKVVELLKSAPRAIKRTEDHSQALRYHKALNDIGIHCLVQADKKPTAEPATELALAGEVEESAAAAASAKRQSAGNRVADRAPAASPLVERPAGAAVEVTSETATVVPQSFQGLTFELAGQPDYGFITVQLPANETLRVEASAMATMSTNMVMKTKAKGGLGRFITGESIFINEFTADGGPGEIGIAPGCPGDVKHLYLQDEEVFLQNSAFVASSMGVVTESKWQGLTKGFFSGESLFLIRCSGTGDLWFNTYGAIIEIDVQDDYVVDTGNIVAFTSGLDYNITKVGGYKSLFFSGEGFVCRFSGQGKVWIQTRGVAAFTSWAHWFRPTSSK
ncbi:TIGR00266 family protein [Oceanobacter mangrovi]|uniref:TIGR00266 family protein n=1 Tax=Oceanobacter mangrovi TaxID=2862510 RepID=UPI001C8E9126|nr:TIGR00266 family protein [Oceanobacter mangrovi]